MPDASPPDPEASELVTAPESSQRELRELHAMLSEALHEGSPLSLSAPDHRQVGLPVSVVSLLRQAVETLARGDALSLLPIHQELTTQEAADLLNVSRQYLVRLVDAGELPGHRIGTHRRLKLSDVLSFKRRRDAERSEALRELTSMTEEFDGYPELK